MEEERKARDRREYKLKGEKGMRENTHYKKKKEIACATNGLEPPRNPIKELTSDTATT